MYPGLFASRTKQGSKGQPPLGGVWGVPTFPLFFPVRGGEDGNFRKALICDASVIKSGTAVTEL